MKSRFMGLLLAAGLALGLGAAKADDTQANLRLMAFGGDAQLTAIKHAIARFNTKYPNVKVDVSIDPISNGWGDYVTHVLSQFNANNAYDVYGTAIETFKTSARRTSDSAAGAMRPASYLLTRPASAPILSASSACDHPASLRSRRMR